MGQIEGKKSKCINKLSLKHQKKLGKDKFVIKHGTLRDRYISYDRDTQSRERESVRGKIIESRADNKKIEAGRENLKREIEDRETDRETHKHKNRRD